MNRGRVAQTRVGDVMQKSVISVTENTTIAELKELFDKYDYNAFPVVRNGELVGIVAKLDFLRVFSPGRSISLVKMMDLWAEKVGDIMRKAVVHISPESSLQEVIEFMVEFRLRSLPVVDNGKLVGMVAIKDVMPHLMIKDK